MTDGCLAELSAAKTNQVLFFSQVLPLFYCHVLDNALVTNRKAQKPIGNMTSELCLGGMKSRISTLLNDPVISIPSSTAHVREFRFEKYSIHYSSHKTTNQLPALRCKQSSFATKARKASELEIVFENCPYSESGAFRFFCETWK